MSNNEYDQELYSQSLIQNDITYKHISNALAYQKDVEYMKQIFPSTLQVIQSEIDEECDKLEYTGSVMFDEYPDKSYLRMIVDTILSRLISAEDSDAEVEGASLDSYNVIPSYCEDDALADCEVDYEVEATQLVPPTPVQETPRGWGRGWGPGRGPGWGPGWGPPPPPPGPWGPNRPCWGPFCPIVNRPCGPGRWCPPIPFADYDKDGNPNWMRHVVESMLTNEMTYRRSRYRNRDL